MLVTRSSILPRSPTHSLCNCVQNRRCFGSPLLSQPFRRTDSAGRAFWYLPGCSAIAVTESPRRITGRLHWPAGRCRFEELLNANTARLHMRLFSKYWFSIRMGLVHSLLFTATALITFLLRDVVPTSYAGASLVYAFQVREHIHWWMMNEWKCIDCKCVRKPTKSRLCLTRHANKSCRWAEFLIQESVESVR